MKRSVLLVDDELLVRTNLKLMLTESAGEIVVCGEATNGEEALKLLERLTPDIILADMKMPRMDGVELAAAVHERYPHIAYLVLSNYDDYRYVRGALKNGARDYLLKHELHASMLIRTLLETELGAKQVSSEDELSALVPANLIPLRRRYILNLLNGLYQSDTGETILMNFRMLSIRLELSNIIPIILCVDNYAQLLEGDDLKKRSLLEFSIINIAEEILQLYPSGVIVHLSNENYGVLLSFPHVISEQTMESGIQAVVRHLSSQLLNYLNVSASFIIGARCKDHHELSKSFRDAEAAVHTTFYTGSRSIIRAGEALRPEAILSGLDHRLERKFLSAAMNADLQQLQMLLRALFEDMVKRKITLSSAQMVFADLVSVISHLMRENQYSAQMVFDGDVQPADLMVKIKTLEEIEAWFQASFANLVRLLQSPPPSVESQHVKRAVSFLNRNYAASISQQSVAEEIGITGSYLSTVFKEEMGVGFSEYLNSLRIAKAKALLRAGDRDIRQVSEACGFQDYSYFLKVFKKNTGATPGEYLRSDLE